MYTAKLCTIQGYLCRHKGLDFKGTVSVISSEPPDKDDIDPIYNGTLENFV